MLLFIDLLESKVCNYFDAECEEDFGVVLEELQGYEMLLCIDLLESKVCDYFDA